MKDEYQEFQWADDGGPVPEIELGPDTPHEVEGVYE